MHNGDIVAVLALVMFIVAGVMYALERAFPPALMCAGLALVTWALLLR